MFAAMVSTGDLSEGSFLIRFRSGSNEYAVYRSITDVPDNASRIPLSIFEQVASKHDTRWLNPTTATEGMSRLQTLKSEFLAQLSDTTRGETYSSDSAIIDGQKKQKSSLVDIQDKRRRLKERASRW